MYLSKSYTVLVAVLLSCLAMTGTAKAQWTGGVEGGTVLRDGESATRLRGYASLNARPLSHYLYAEWYRFESDSLELGYEPRYWLNKKLYTFGDGRFRVDKDRGIDQQTMLIAGMGMQFLATDVQHVWLEAGAGYRFVTYTQETGLEDNDEPVGTASGGASQVVNDLFKLEAGFDVFTSSSYLESQVELGVSMRVAQGAIKLSQRIRRVDIDGLDSNTDSDTGVVFTYGF